MPGPERSCNCGDLIECMICRRREQQRRYANNLPRLTVLRPGVRASRLTLPTEPCDLAYVAGLFDGEGCITRANDHVILQVGMTDGDVIAWLGSFGGTIRVEQPPGNRKPLHRWRVLARLEVVEFLQAVRPYMRVKAGAADAALDELLALERAA